MCADPSWIILPTHVANLVNPVLEGGDSAADKSPQEIIAYQACPHKLLNNLVNVIDLTVRVPWVEAPVVLLRGGSKSKYRQVQMVDIV